MKTTNDTNKVGKKKVSHIGSSWDSHKKKLMADPEFCEAFEELRPEFEMAESLLRLRYKKKLSQKKLASKAGTKQPAIARLESAQYTGASLATLKKIAKALDAKLIVKFESR
jgi:ribosome-binding protein aMBF1 (putative translation factor)